MKPALLSVAFATCLGCRVAPGPSEYESQENFVMTDAGSGPAPEFLAGPNPYQPGSKRLSVGIFYEGASSETVAIDNTVTHFYVYEESFAVEPDRDRLEGLSSDRIVHTGGAFWGGGVAWDVPRDLSAWQTLHVSLRADGVGFETVNLSMNSSTEAKLSASAYGYKNDGEWHSLAIPVSDFVAKGFDPTKVRSPFVLSGPGGNAGEVLRIDDVYFDAKAP